MIFEILQSRRSMHLSATVARVALMGSAGAFLGAASLFAQNELGSATIPSRIVAGWGHGTPEWEPFFEGEVTGAEPGAAPRRLTMP